MEIDKEIIMKEQELNSLIDKDNHAYWHRTGDNFDVDVTKARNELNDLNRKRDAQQKDGE